jgi:hypothetical protein
MVWYILVGMLAAFGSLCIIWTLLGWILPAGQGCALVCYGLPDTGILSRWKWLRGVGLLHCPLVAVTEHPSSDTEIEQCSGESLLSLLEMERKRFNGTGNGDSSGHHRCRGISEL